MQEISTFGECLTGLLRKKHISTADLTRRMNYRSKTSITRLLRDEVRYSSIEDFMKRLEPVGAWLLTGAEMQELRDAMEVNRLGRVRYQTYREIWRLIEAGDASAAQVTVEGFGSARAQTLGELAESWHEARKIEMLIVNSGYEGLFREIEELLRRCPEKQIEIRHFLTMCGAPGAMAGQLGAVMAVFHDPRYQGFYRNWKGSGLSGMPEEGNAMVVQGERADGTAFVQLIVMKDSLHGLAYERDRLDDLMPFAQQVIGAAGEGMLPLKTQYPEQELIEGLLVISRRYLSCEQDRATICLAPDICFELIPYEIMYQVMFDSAPKDFDPDSGMLRLLAQVHRDRYQNIHTKKKPTSFVFSREGLERFAETGRTTDHIAGMRNFTPAERAAILRDVVTKCRKNVYLRVHVLKPETRVRGMTLTAHGGLGVYLLDSYTQYYVVNGHSEAFILMPEFATAIEDFFRDELIEKCALPVNESLEILERLAERMEAIGEGDGWNPDLKLQKN